MVLVENFLEVHCRQFPGTRFNFRNCFIGLTTYHPASCVVAILSNSKTTSVSSTRMLKTAEKRNMKLGFLRSFVTYPFHFRIEFGAI